MNRILIIFALSFMCMLYSCIDEPNTVMNTVPSLIDSTDPELPGNTYNAPIQVDIGAVFTDIDYPVHYDNMIVNRNNQPVNNRINNAEANLGRVLFYDTNLSINGTISCASCHQQENGFTDDARFSRGQNGGMTGAHSMRLGNATFYEPGSMFWDKRAMTLEDQVLQPIQDPVEMGFDSNNGGLQALTDKLQRIDYYSTLFQNVYGSSVVTLDGIQRSLAQFVRSIVSTDSKYDRGYAQVYDRRQPNGGANTPFTNFTASENRGKTLFLNPPNQGGAGCAGCHNPVTLALAADSRSNGLDRGETAIFKSPSLKNIAITGPYMHDGRFTTLLQVVEHYNSGIQEGPALDNRLRARGRDVQRLNLTNQQKNDLVAFMNTLTDESLLTDRKYSNPFR